jgi:hypothetical protein
MNRYVTYHSSSTPRPIVGARKVLIVVPAELDQRPETVARLRRPVVCYTRPRYVT